MIQGGSTAASTIFVYIVAGFEPLRAGLARALAEEPDLRVVGDAPSLEEMLGDEAYATSDVLVVDVDVLSGGNLQAVYAELGERITRLKVLFLGSAVDARAITFDTIPMLMALHTIGFVLKDGNVGRIAGAIRQVRSGIFSCETDVIKRVLTRLAEWADHSPSGQNEQLSAREMEVLLMVARGHSNRDVAQALFLSEGTVKGHVRRLMVKLNVGRRTELAHYALANDLLPSQET